MMSSAWLVAYGNLLLILQYISCFAAVDAVPGLFLKKEVPCVELASKVSIKIALLALCGASFKG